MSLIVPCQQGFPFPYLWGEDSNAQMESCSFLMILKPFSAFELGSVPAQDYELCSSSLGSLIANLKDALAEFS